MSQVTHTTALSISDRIRDRQKKGELTEAQVKAFDEFLGVVNKEIMQHRIITDNRYTRWFQKGTANNEELKHFIVQFSVFSNLFLIAQLLKVINAPSLEQMRAGKEILLNELGVVYRKPRKDGKGTELVSRSEKEKDIEGDPALVNIEGTVEGSTYRHKAAHYEWMLKVGETLGLGYDDLGKRWQGTKSTLHFCDELSRLYGSEDGQIAEGASFAVENWAAAGFWQELEDGLVSIRDKKMPDLKIAFFSWHNRVEGQHAAHVMEELEEVYFSEDFDRKRFMIGAKEILEAVATFWDGLEDDRQKGKAA